ncbi:hypothetical protein V7968_28960 [Nocardia vulneris]|uniref:hypothetical protein n=1 Tax=Nocardia vulneris TaxID=1141657 RepID=UPI0030D15CA7
MSSVAHQFIRCGKAGQTGADDDDGAGVFVAREAFVERAPDVFLGKPRHCDPSGELPLISAGLADVIDEATSSTGHSVDEIKRPHPSYNPFANEIIVSMCPKWCKQVSVAAI